MSIEKFGILYENLVTAIQHCVVEGIRNDDDEICISETNQRQSVVELVDFLYNNIIIDGEINRDVIQDIHDAFPEANIYPVSKDGNHWTRACFNFELDGEQYNIYFG